MRQLILENGSYTDKVFPSQPFYMAGWESSPVPGDTFWTLNKSSKLKDFFKSFHLKSPPIHSKILGKMKESGARVTIGSTSFIEYSASFPLNINLVFKCDNYGSSEAIMEGINGCVDERVKLNVFYCGIENFSSQLLQSLSTSDST